MSIVYRGRALALGCALAATLTTVGSANHSWGNYHWARTSNPFTLKLGDNVSGAWDSSLGIASGDWTQSSVLNTTIVAGSTRPRNCRPTAGRVEVCNSTYGNNGWLGIAQIWASGSHITQGIVKLNDTYYSTPTYNTPAWRNFVMCQEIGHTLGLGHQDEDFGNQNLGSCMDYGDPTGDSRQEHPNAHDYNQLETIYAHLDSTTTVAAQLPNEMSPAMRDIDFATPSQWGRMVMRSPNGRTSIHELDFGRGQKVITFVVWVTAEDHQH